MSRRSFAGMRSRDAAGAGLSLLLVTGGAKVAKAQVTGGNQEGVVMTTGDKFYCYVKALNPTEWARHKQLTEKLSAVRKEVVETTKGYEFQFSPAKVTLAELAEWVAAEGKCCPFLDFHIDVEHEGTLLCLRLTGEEGVKGFIRMEFGVGDRQR
jgi:hypothetical protein